jgi:large subunit ribosomal protein L5
MAARLKEFYQQKVIPALKQELGYANVMQIPQLKKIVVNMGLGDAVQNPKLLETGVSELTQITGQKPVVTKAHKSIANFKLREGMAIGCAVTLRGDRMYEFFDRLVNVALPRVRDFRGIPENAFDGRGNYSLGIREHVIFPEINVDKVEQVKGFTVSFVT